MDVILINSVSLYPLYLIPILILHSRTISKKKLCVLCVETDTNRNKRQKPAQIKNFIIQQSRILYNSCIFLTHFIRELASYALRLSVIASSRWGVPARSPWTITR
jgi:hypothetical protein